MTLWLCYRFTIYRQVSCNQHSFFTDTVTIVVGNEGRVTGLGVSTISVRGTNTSVSNDGIVECLGSGQATIVFNGVVVPSPASLVNSGLIAWDCGVHLFGLGGSFKTDNSGTIRTAIIAVRDQSDAGSTDAIRNTGRIIGDVLQGAGDDRFDGRGGRLDGEVFGNEGRDRLIGGADGDRLHGGLGQDTLTGGGGADRFVFDVTPGRANADDITDFGGADRILLQDTNFRVLPQGGAASFRFAHLDARLAIDASGFLVI